MSTQGSGAVGWRAILRVDTWIWLLLLLFAVGAVSSLWLSYPDGPSYSLSATTEHLELSIPKPGAQFVWTDLRLRQVDSRAANCSLKELVLGKQPATIELDGAFSRTSRGDGKTPSSPSSFWITLRPSGGADPFLIACDGNTSYTVKTSARLEPLQAVSGMTLSFFSNLTVGASPDVKGSYSNILLSGTLRATAKLRGSMQPGAFSQYDLVAGDKVSLMGREPSERAVAGLIWPTGDGFRLVAQSAGTNVYIDRLGIGRINEVDLTPSTISIIQADPFWLVVTAILAAMLTFFPVVEKYVVRLWQWSRGRPTNSNRSEE